MQIKFIENFNINLNFADNFHENSRMALHITVISSKTETHDILEIILNSP